MATTPARSPRTPGDLVIDVGNSSSKLGWFTGEQCLHLGTVTTGDAAALRTWVGEAPITRIVIGSVAAADAWIAELGSMAPVIVVRGDQPSPLKSRYITQGTLGVDRLANAVAAHAIFNGRPAMAIALGSCIIYDVVAADATYLGGAISPGFHMRSRAMHEFSARLPATVLDTEVEDLGTSTQGSLLAGIHHGIVHELKGWIESLRQQHAHLAVVLTGGDAPRFARALKSGIFADPSLTLRGLHALLPYALPPSVTAGDAGR